MENESENEGIGNWRVVSAMASRAFGFKLKINENEMLAINSKIIGVLYTDCKAATYLYGSTAKKSLNGNLFVDYLDCGSGIDVHIVV